MVEQITSDAFLAPINILVHQANCMHTMGSGIAKSVREMFPEAYEKDCKDSVKGDKGKMGDYTVAKLISPNPNKDLKYIVNLYSQYEFGRDRKHTSYDAMVAGFTKLRDHLIAKGKTDTVIGVPYKIGCNLGGGDWKIVETLLRTIFDDSQPIKLVICKHPDLKD